MEYLKDAIKDRVLGIIPGVKINLPHEVEVNLTPLTDGCNHEYGSDIDSDSVFSIDFIPDNTRANANKFMCFTSGKNYDASLEEIISCMKYNDYTMISDKVWCPGVPKSYWKDNGYNSSDEILPRKIVFRRLK